MNRWESRVALVTGASSGIGEAICRTLVQHGLQVVGCARNVDNIQKIADDLVSSKGNLHAIKCDLAKEDEILSMFQWIKTNLGGVDICINNAGLSIHSPLLEGTVEMWRQILDVNVVALCLCTRESVKSMRERGVDDGQIIHISSLSGHRVPPNPVNNFYCASKFAVRALTEGLRQELRALNSKIRISAISPGYTETNFTLNASGSEEMSKQIYSSMQCIQSSDIADMVVYILSTPSYVQIHDILVRPVEQKF